MVKCTSVWRLDAFGDGWGRKLLIGAVLLVGGGILGSCSSSRNEVDLACPALGFVRGTESITLFGSGDGNAQDVRFEAFISNLTAKCSGNRRRIRVRTSFEIVARRGPASDVDVIGFPFFVAVVSADQRVLNKKVFESVIRFQPNQLRAGIREVVEQEIRLGEDQDREDFEILTGFQLSSRQFEYNYLR